MSNHNNKKPKISTEKPPPPPHKPLPDDELHLIFVKGNRELLNMRFNDMMAWLRHSFGYEHATTYADLTAAAKSDPNLMQATLLLCGPSAPKFWTEFRRRCRPSLFEILNVHLAWIYPKVVDRPGGSESTDWASLHHYVSAAHLLIGRELDPYGEFAKKFGTSILVSPGTPIAHPPPLPPLPLPSPSP